MTQARDEESDREGEDDCGDGDQGLHLTASLDECDDSSVPVARNAVLTVV